MPIWKHALENLIALTSLLLMPYVLIATGLTLAFVWVAVRRMGGTYLKFRGTRVIRCPETKEPAGVNVDALHAAVTAARARPHLRLEECSRWPERRSCGQACLKQIERAPEDCLVQTILTRWYAGKSCVYCGKRLAEIHRSEHKPALVSPEGRTVEWNELRPESIPYVLATHLPVCWDCHIAQTFRREHPELVVDREWRSAGLRSHQG